MSKEAQKDKKAVIPVNSPAYRKLLATNAVLELSRDATGYIDPEALDLYRRAILGVNKEAKELIEIQDALLGEEKSTSQ